MAIILPPIDDSIRSLIASRCESILATLTMVSKTVGNKGKKAFIVRHTRDLTRTKFEA